MADARGNFIARGFWAAKSPIALRVLSRQDMDLDEELLATRLRRAWERRRAIFPRADAFRLAHGEADLLPGYFVDVYGGVAAVQHLAEWTEARREQLARGWCRADRRPGGGRARRRLGARVRALPRRVRRALRQRLFAPRTRGGRRARS